MSLIDIAQQITIYYGIFLLIIGIIGNGINILVFSNVRSYRTTPCTFYFLIASIDNMAYITINLISRIISTITGFDLTRTSIIWCKIRQFFIITPMIITLSCSCLAAIDQFFVTSKNANVRRFSNIKWAHRITIIMVIFWCVDGILPLLFYSISPLTKTCTYTDYGFSIYAVIYLIGLVTIIPILIMIVFGYLTYRNIHMTTVLARQQIDRQLIRMIFIEVVLDVICFLPYGIYNLYLFITSGVHKDTNRLITENFIMAIIGLVTYFYYAGSCYMFLISSSRFRHATKDRLLFYFKRNQVVPTQTTQLAEGTPNK